MQVENKNAGFVMPPFCHKDQFTAEEVDETYNIASCEESYSTSQSTN